MYLSTLHIYKSGLVIICFVVLQINEMKIFKNVNLNPSILGQQCTKYYLITKGNMKPDVLSAAFINLI